MDPDYYDGFEDGEEYVYDTYDRVVGEDEVFGEQEHSREDDYDWDISGAEMGLMGALADELSEDKQYDVDENTDRENWDKVMRMTSLDTRHQTGSKLRPFEQYVQDYIRRGFRHPDD